MSDRPTLWTILKRGLRRRCPHCGQGPLFRKWAVILERCPVCGLVYQRNQGDIWAFWVISDRIPLAIGIVAIYLGFRSESWPVLLLFFAGLAVPLIVTIPHRQGLALALDYLTRVYWPDSTDELPQGPRAARR
jgi:uncharacterized protein (DUF983 family)